MRAPEETTLEPLRPADVPEKSGGFWQLVGPGAVLVGLALGAGELIIWPRTTASYGASMTWAAMLGVFLQYWLNCEIARWTLATGESIFAGFLRLSRGWAPVFLLLTVLGWLLPGWARACGGAMKALLVGPDGPGGAGVWTAATFALVTVTLFGPRFVYRSVEIVTEVLVVIIFVGLVAIALTVGGASDWLEVLRGAVSFGAKAPEMPAYELFSAIVFAGAGGTANLFYSFYLRDKGWGMGARFEHERPTGFVPREDESNLRRWRDWTSHTARDQAIFFWFGNSLTILLFIYAAQAALRANGVVPDQENLVWDEAVILSSIWGAPGRVLFLVIGFACLFSTQLTLVDGVARSIADIVHGAYPRARARSLDWWYGVVAATWMMLGTALTFAYERIPAFLFLLSAGFMGGLAMAIYAPLVLWLNERLLPPAYRPGRARLAFVTAIALFYVSFAVFATAVLARRLVAG